MAFVVRRPRGRWEIRESIATDVGPRSRTLANFSKLTDRVLENAERSATRPFHRDQVRQSALRKGVPVEPSGIELTAGQLIARLRHGDPLRPGIRRLLAEALRGDDDDELLEWIGATNEERASALVDLLGLADAIRQR